MKRLRTIDLFSGIGGIGLALRDVSDITAWCEIDNHCRKVLEARIRDGHLDTAPVLPDVRILNDVFEVDLISAGFPCQDISLAGRGKGIDGERSGLFFEVVRIAEASGVPLLFLENVPGIRTRGLGVVVSTLNDIGYDCRWGVVSARDAGAPHLRKRWWLLACLRGATGLWADKFDKTQRNLHPIPFPKKRDPVWHGMDMESWPINGLSIKGRVGALPRLDLSENTGALWPTPCAKDDGKSPEAHLAMKANMPGGERKTITGLTVMVKAIEQGIWPTPRSRDWKEGGTRSWMTPTTKRTYRPLSEVVHWPTPHSNCHTGPGRQGREGGMNIQTAVGKVSGRGSLNPEFVEWLMGYPRGWTSDELVTVDGEWLDAAHSDGPWHSEWPGVPRLVEGVPGRTARLRALGNSVVPAQVRLAWEMLWNLDDGV